jgi:hypothetical protein
MYLAKFFHRPPGDTDRELLLMPGGDPVLLGIHMNWKGEPGTEEYLREEFSSIQAAVSAFRRHASELVAKGYFETDDTNYTLRTLPPDPRPKPDWQKGLDDLMLAALSAPLTVQANHLASLNGTPAEHEPLYLWLAAHHGYAAKNDNKADNDETIRFAAQARDTIAARRAAKAPHYSWSIRDSEIEARALETLSWAQLRADDPAAALEAIDEAYKVAASQDRGAQRALIICDHFPERLEEAFDAAYKWSEFGGYEDVMAHPDYPGYLARRKGQSEKSKGWRWKAKNPASENDVRNAEAALGAKLPEDYRKFLLSRGETELLVRLPDDSAELKFYPCSDLLPQRDSLVAYICRIEKNRDKVAAYFREQYDVSLTHLLPVAYPAQHSRCLLLHLEPGARYGWCYQWDHDGAWELEAAQPSFDAALKVLTDGIKARDADRLSFLGIYLD